MTYELQTVDGKIITWDGETGVDAARRAADCLQVEIIAWRPPRWEFVPAVHHSQIIG